MSPSRHHVIADAGKRIDRWTRRSCAGGTQTEPGERRAGLAIMQSTELVEASGARLGHLVRTIYEFYRRNRRACLPKRDPKRTGHR